MSQAPQELRPDEKGNASLTLGDVVRTTRTNFPDTRFHPHIVRQTPHYTISGTSMNGYPLYTTADGIGTKPELAERLYETARATGNPDAEVFEGLAFDTMAMIDGDVWRYGMYLIGATNIIDMNTAADARVVHALARGLKRACDEGHFALLNGETAELGYRTSGYGETRLNWNASGIAVYNPYKLLSGEIQPGQPLVAFREESIRSNGLSMARKIMEGTYFAQEGVVTREQYFLKKLADYGIVLPEGMDAAKAFSDIFGHNAMEQVLTPWHTTYPEITRQILQPSRLYGPVMYSALGIIDEPANVDMVAAAHISGGGIPEKMMRMVQKEGLGAAVDAVFPDPQAITSILKIAEELPEQVKHQIGINDQIASQQWNRGIGFVVVTRDSAEAQKLVDIAAAQGYEAAIAGEITDKPEIQFRGHTWKYSPTE